MALSWHQGCWTAGQAQHCQHPPPDPETLKQSQLFYSIKIAPCQSAGGFSKASPDNCVSTTRGVVVLGQGPVLTSVMIHGRGGDRSVINTQQGLNGWRSLWVDGREDQREGRGIRHWHGQGKS